MKPTPHQIWLHGDTAKYKPPKKDRARRGEGQKPKIHMEHNGMAACRRRGYYLEKTTDRAKVDCANCRLVMFNWRDE